MLAWGEFSLSSGVRVRIAAGPAGVRRIEVNPSAPCEGTAAPGHPMVASAAAQLAEYFAAKRTAFTVPLDLGGTAFQRRVWSVLLTIPYGETRSYRWLAANAGCPRGFQAVGQANGANPVCIVVPCHRVIASDGSLGGYAYGLDFKRRLLELERLARGL